MPNLDFYAFGPDHKSVLDYVFTLPCRVFELGSAYDSELAEFSCTADIESHFNINWETTILPCMLLQIYPANAGGRIIIERLELDSTKCDGATFQYSCGGWGMIQLYLFGLVHGELRESQARHNSEKRALKWESTGSKLGAVADWDFKVVNSISRKLNRFIKINSVASYGSLPIMDSASDFFDLS